MKKCCFNMNYGLHWVTSIYGLQIMSQVKENLNLSYPYPAMTVWSHALTLLIHLGIDGMYIFSRFYFRSGFTMRQSRSYIQVYARTPSKWIYTFRFFCVIATAYRIWGACKTQIPGHPQKSCIKYRRWIVTWSIFSSYLFWGGDASYAGNKLLNMCT